MRELLSPFGGKRRQSLLLVLSVIYAICLVWGKDIMLADTIVYCSLNVLLRIFFNFILIYIIMNFIFLIFKFVTSRITLFYSNKSQYLEISDKRLFFFVFLLIVICWMPTYITCWPGLGIYDGPGQVNNISTHHPVMHTLIIHFCNAMAKQFGWISWLLPYAVLQLSFLASVFSYQIVTLKRWKITRFAIGLITVWFCIFPMHALMALASTKDSIFAGFFVLFICKIGDMLIMDINSLTRGWYIKYWLVCFMLCAFRNNGVFVLFFFIPFMKLIPTSKKIILISLTVVITYIVYQGPVMNMLHVEKGDSKEALSIIIQSLSRTYHEKNTELSEEEKSAIIQLFGNQAPWYESHISDAAKSQFDSTVFFNRFEYYSKLYIRLGIRYPHTYMDAMLANTYGNWYPHEMLPDPTAYRMYFEFPSVSAEEYGSIWPNYYNFLQNLSRESSYLRIPIVYILFCTGIVFWEILFLLVCVIDQRNYKKMIIFIPFLTLWGTIMLGPVALFRYTYPLMVGLPLLGCITYKEYNKQA